VVWDRLNAHRSQLTTAFIAAHAQDYAVAYLSVYAPEQNPEEQSNACVKRTMASRCPDQSLICTTWPAANSVACKVNPR
jgi:hypothetical protein